MPPSAMLETTIAGSLPKPEWLAPPRVLWAPWSLEGRALDEGKRDAALDPVRSRLLAELARPASAASLAKRLGIARQKINYHLRALEAHRLVRVDEERRWGGLTERRLVATAASFRGPASSLRQ
jgi:DNA-binding transcriptional ArsR family regulator